MSGDADARARYDRGMAARRRRLLQSRLKARTRTEMVWPPLTYDDTIADDDILCIKRTDRWERRVTGLKRLNDMLAPMVNLTDVLGLQTVIPKIFAAYILYAVRQGGVTYTRDTLLPRPFFAYVELYAKPGSTALRPRVTLEHPPGAILLMESVVRAPGQYECRIAHTATISLSAGAGYYRNPVQMANVVATADILVTSFAPMRRDEQGFMKFRDPLEPRRVTGVEDNARGQLVFGHLRKNGTWGVRTKNPKVRSSPVKLFATLTNGANGTFAPDALQLEYLIRVHNPSSAMRSAFNLNDPVFVDPVRLPDHPKPEHPSAPRTANFLGHFTIGSQQTAAAAGMIGNVIHVTRAEDITGDMLIKVSTMGLGF